MTAITPITLDSPIDEALVPDLVPDRETLAAFVAAVFENASSGYVSLRAFGSDNQPAGQWRSVAVTDTDTLITEAERLASEAATLGATFCPPVATFQTAKSAGEPNLAQGVALSVDLDKHPDASLTKLRGLIGEPTVIVASGGEWIDTDSGEAQPKLHAHWRLLEPTETAEEHAQLKRARKAAIRLAGGDPTNAPAVHPLRWPGSWHLKGEPRLCRIIGGDSEREITLPDALEWLEISNSPDTTEHHAAPGTAPDDESLIRAMHNGEQWHEATTSLAFRMIDDGMDPRRVVQWLRAAFPDDDGTGRWQSRRDDIPRLVRDAQRKLADRKASTDSPEPVDLFTARGVPRFPLETLPQAWQALARETSAQTGFDAGAYGFALLIQAANLIDHRAHLKITDSWRERAFQWGALVDVSGGGKSPVMSAAGKGPDAIYNEMVKESRRALAKWHEEAENMPKGEPMPPRPAWRQRKASDTTVEALGQLLCDNPDGVNLVFDEMTEWIGRMDAYTAGQGGKDRAVYLSAWNGQQVTVNRSGKSAMVIDNFSVGILAGIQPEKLAAMLKRGQGSSDGLFQRFMVYQFQPAGNADLMADLSPFTEANAANVFDRLNADDHASIGFELSREARSVLQEYVNNMRTLAGRTAAQRFSEHLHKFPGFASRLALSLHCIDAAAAQGPPPAVVSAETTRRALSLMSCLYRHSEAVYGVLDDAAQEVWSLVQSAAEAILSQGFETVQRGDLTRRATHWKGADRQSAENAIDLLTELNWLRDVTPAREPGRPGRRSEGRFAVNPLVHERFAEHSERIKTERAERYEALQAVAAERREGN